MAKATCPDCKRIVIMAEIGGTLVATDPELMTVVPARQRSSPSSDLPSIRMAHTQTYARRVHAERCADYQEQARRDRIAADLRAFNRKHGIKPAAKARSHGL